VDRDKLVELAEVMRPELPELAPDAVPELDVLLDRLKSGEPVDDDVFELLTRTGPLRRRVNHLLPAEEDVAKGGAGYNYQEMPGHGEPVAAAMYICPEGDYRYPVLEVGEQVPPCPKHNIPLIPC
jgi:hypothetical protein